MARQFPLAGLVLLCIGAGCGSEGGGGGSATPSADLARAALEKSLNAWKEGKRPGSIPETDPQVQAIDFKWQGGAKLESFDILRDEAAEPERRFVVQLRLGAPPVTEEVRYMVVGKGPILVYRDQDYQRMLNMDNSPVPATTKKRGR